MTLFVWWRWNGQLHPQLWHVDKRECVVETGYGPNAARYFAEHLAAEHKDVPEGMTLNDCIVRWPPPPLDPTP